MAISSDLSMEFHLDQVLASCASSEYALRQLRSYGLQPLQLHQVAKATTLASLMYAAPSWWGYTSAKDRARVDRLVCTCRLKRRGFLSAETPDVATLVSEAGNRLFQAIIADPNHVLRKHFPDIKRSNYNLRPLAHEFTLPLKDDRNFIP